MTLTEFRNNIIEGIKYETGDEYVVLPQDVIKNNGVEYHGILIKDKGKDIAPTIYIDGMYEEYCRSGDISIYIEKVIMLKKMNTNDIEFDPYFFEDFDKVKEYIYVKLVNKEENLKILFDTPHKDFLDMTMIVYCNTTKVCKIPSKILIKEEHLKMWKVSKDRLFEIAINNTRKSGSKIFDISDFVKNSDEEMFSNVSEGVMYVLTNKENTEGAVCMTFDNELDTFCEKTGSGIYIIPSSIHEVLLVPEKTVFDIAMLNEMIKEVNKSSLEREEILSNHAYYYSINEGYSCV